MEEIEFKYKDFRILVQCSQDEKFKEILKKLDTILKIDLKSQNLIYSNEEKINEELTFNDIANEEDKSKKLMKIIIAEKPISSLSSNKSIIKSKEVICPECGETAIFNITDYQIHINNCKNGHLTDNILLDEYEKTQLVDLSKIICDKCKKIKKSETSDNIFYICISCKNNLCPSCQIIHDKKHNIIDYSLKNYICEKHNQKYIYYCYDCKKNICNECLLKEHEKHYIYELKNDLTKKDELKSRIGDFKETINEFKKNINNIIEKLNKTKENFDLYYKIINDIYNSYDENKLNNKTVENLKGLIQNKILDDFDEVIQEEDICNKFNKIWKIYKNMTSKDINEITLTYKFDKIKKSLVILGEEFVKNNKDICKLVYEGDELYLRSSYHFYKDDNLPKNNFIIKLKGLKNLTNIKGMFHSCDKLIHISDLSQWNTSKITDMSYLFYRCQSLTSLPDISNWNTKNVTNLGYMFALCTKLTSLPNISKWNISNATDINHLFSQCNSLLSIPDISNWDCKNITNFSHLFYGCNKLTYLPDLSEWTLNNAINISYMFKNCSLLTHLPDISGWNIEKVTDISYMFCECTHLTELPEISFWDTRMVKYADNLFCGCTSLISFPDISNWDLSNVNSLNNFFCKCMTLKSLPNISIWDMKNKTSLMNMFCGCTNLLTIPDIGEWNVSNVTNLISMFCGCKSLKSLPDISKWNTRNFNNITEMFLNCESLKRLPDISKWDISNVKYMNNMFSGCDNSLEIPDKFKK